MTTPYNIINTPFLPTTLISTVRPSVAPKHPEIDYQTNRPRTKKRPLNKSKHTDGNKFPKNIFDFLPIIIKTIQELDHILQHNI